MEFFTCFNLDVENKPENPAKTLADNLKRVKDHRQMSEVEIAELCKVGTGSVNRVLHVQNVQLKVVSALADGLKIAAWALLTPNLSPEPAKRPVAIPRDDLEATIEAEVNKRLDAKWADVKEGLRGIRVNGETERRPTRNAVTARKVKGGKTKGGSAPVAGGGGRNPDTSAKKGSSS